MLFMSFCYKLRNLSLLPTKGPTFLNFFYIFFDTLNAFFHKLKLKVAWAHFYFFNKIMLFYFSFLKLQPRFLYFTSILFLLFYKFTSQSG